MPGVTDPSQILDLYRFLGSLGVGGSIAGLLFFFYRKDVRSYTELWQMQAATNQKQTEAMMALVERVSIIITANTEVVKSLHRRMDRLDILHVVPEDGREHDRGHEPERRRS